MLMGVCHESARMKLMCIRQGRGRPHRRRVAAVTVHRGGRVDLVGRLEEPVELRVAAAALQVA